MAYDLSLVDAALQLDRQSNHFQVEFAPEEAHVFAQHCTAHPIRPETFDALLTGIDALAPRMQFQPGNPNNGLALHRYRIGKAYSRVVYVDMSKGCVQCPFDWARLAQQIMSLGKRYGADEREIQEDTADFLTIRLWWD